jgi:hypothetical protein
MAVAYRTKMTISPTQTGRDNAIMLKSDHFLKDLSPKHLRYQNYNKKKWVLTVIVMDASEVPEVKLFEGSAAWVRGMAFVGFTHGKKAP